MSSSSSEFISFSRTGEGLELSLDVSGAGDEGTGVSSCVTGIGLASEVCKRALIETGAGSVYQMTGSVANSLSVGRWQLAYIVSVSCI